MKIVNEFTNDMGAAFGFVSSKCGKLASLAMVALLALTFVEDASAVAVLADIGVDLADYVPLMATGLGTVVAAVIGVWGAFKLVKLGIGWCGKIKG